MQKSAKMIKVSAEKASKVITALKLYAHKDTVGVLVPHDVIKDIEMVLTLYYNQIKYGVEIFRNYEEVPPVLCYPDKLHQVWVNIINNALQAMDYKGRLIIRVSKNQDKVLVSISGTESSNLFSPQRSWVREPVLGLTSLNGFLMR
jgi:two-component system NtrC family sensor kinase